MAALANLFKRRSSIPYNALLNTRFFSTEPLVDSSPSFVQRLRDLPKDLPGTNIKKEVSQVKFSSYPTPQFHMHFTEFSFLISGLLTFTLIN